MIHQRSRLHDPGVSFSGSRVVPFLSAIYSALLLCFAHEDDTFIFGKSSTALVGDIVFTLTFLECDHRDVVTLDVALNPFDETPGDRFDHRCRGHRMSSVDADELQNPFYG